MKILGIESSCDETAAAVVENGTKIISNVVASSVELHAKTGGIIPEEAARQQIKSIIPVIEESVSSLPSPKSSIDAIAVTIGPGLIGSLLVGVETAKTLSLLWNKPLIPVNHLIGHMYANFLEQNKANKTPSFPAISLVVSGGHTDLVLMKSHTQIERIGTTRDDAAGEAFDKTARLLGLPYPGGPSISAAATNAKTLELKLFPRPMINEKNFDFSFSGLKTAVLNKVKEFPSLTKNQVDELAAEVQEAIVDVLISKTIRAVKQFKPKSLLLSGGVSSNSRLREKLNSELKKTEAETDLYIPEPKFCTDNAAYIASAAYFHNKTVSWKEVTANPELTITDVLS